MNAACFPMSAGKSSYCFHGCLQNISWGNYKQGVCGNRKLATYSSLFAGAAGGLASRAHLQVVILPECSGLTQVIQKDQSLIELQAEKAPAGFFYASQRRMTKLHDL
jgi:hypothetical protein